MFTFAAYVDFQMSPIHTIQNIIESELKRFNEAIVASMQNDNPILEAVVEYVFQQKGKQLRPMLVLLAAKMLREVNQSTIQGAVAMELLHTASLIHDDVIDDTHERRGNLSINAKWNNKVAVLSGDYMLSIALSQVALSSNIQMVKAVSFIGAQLSDGELLQLQNTQNNIISEAEYFQIIKKKTALLFSVCMQIGGLSINANQQEINNLMSYGEYLGYCFQIKDDIFDYYTNANIGKPTQNDIKDGKVTLPLIYALGNASSVESSKIINLLKSNQLSAEEIDSIYRFAVENGGIELAINQMNNYKKKAIDALNDFPDNPYKKALIDCVEYAINRSN